MRILDRKLLLDLLTALATSLALTTSAFLFGYFYAHSRWLEGVRPGVLLSWLLHYLPTSAAQGMPVAFAVATVISASRFRSEGGLVSLQAAGIPLLALATPYLFLALAASAFNLWVGEVLGPLALREAKYLWWEVVQGAGSGMRRLAGKPLDLGDGRVLLFSGYDQKEGVLQDVRLFQVGEGGNPLLLVTAKRGWWVEEGAVLEGWRLYRLRLDRLPDALWYSTRPPKGTLAAYGKGGSLVVTLGMDAKGAIARFADDGVPRPLPEVLAEAYFQEGQRQGRREVAASEGAFRVATALAPLGLSLLALALAWGELGGAHSPWGTGILGAVFYYGGLLGLKALLGGSGPAPVAFLLWPLGLLGLGLGILARR